MTMPAKPATTAKPTRRPNQPGPKVEESRPDDRDYVSREDALRLLGVKRPTLYTYVSRGWIHSLPLNEGRKHVFSREDISRMQARSMARAGAGARAESAMRYGEPVITTRITEITPEGPRYRNRLALDLARQSSTFEAVAVLLWTGAWLDDQLHWLSDLPDFQPDALVKALGGNQAFDEILKTLACTVLALGVRTRSAAELQRGDTLDAARKIIQMMTGMLGLLSPRRRYVPVRAGESLAASAARSLGLPASDETCYALNAMMVLCADYELTPANFTARVVASSGGDLHACVAAGLCAHSGTLTGQICDKLEELLLDNATRQSLERRLETVRKLGVKVYGFNHPLYPRGDPRAYWMIDLARTLKPKSRAAQNAIWFLERVQEDCHMYPGLPAGLVALGIALDLPRKSTPVLWGIARTAGQIAHVIEQRNAGFVLRPRARFVAS